MNKGHKCAILLRHNITYEGALRTAFGWWQTQVQRPLNEFHGLEEIRDFYKNNKPGQLLVMHNNDLRIHYTPDEDIDIVTLIQRVDPTAISPNAREGTPQVYNV